MLEFRLRFVTTDQPVLKTAYYEVNDYERRYPSELPADHDPLRLRRRVRDPLHEASRSSSTPAAVWISSTRSTASSKIGLTTFAKISPRAVHAGFFVPCGICDVTKPRRVCVRRRKEISIIFSGGVYGGENTARLANVRIGRLWCTMRALQRAAISSTEDPAKRSSVERVPAAHAKTPLLRQRGFDLCDFRKTQTIRLSRT